MPGMTLPPGFRFHPTDEELVDYYLKKRVKNISIEFDVIADVDLYKCEPWDLPSKSKLPQGDNEWFFFSPRDRKYPNGSRTNRATEAGYWKATGRDRTVKTGAKTIGMKKTLVFYRGRAPHGERTDWLMHEYRIDGVEWDNMNVPQDAYVLCRVFKKNGFPPKNPSGSGSMDDADHVDSPGEVKSPAFSDHDVKPSIRGLANLPALHPPQPAVTAPPAVTHMVGLPVQDHAPADNNPGNNLALETRANVFANDPFALSGSFRFHDFPLVEESERFFVDEGLDKARNDESLDDFYDICPPLESVVLGQLPDDDVYSTSNNDMQAAGGCMANGFSSKIVRNEYVKNEFQQKWQEQVSSAYQGFGSQPKQEEFDISSLIPENDFGPLPPLVQLPSPSNEENNDFDLSCVSSGITNNNLNNFASIIRLRTRPSSGTSPGLIGGLNPEFTAQRRVLFQLASDSFPVVSSAKQKSSDAAAAAEVAKAVDNEVGNSKNVVPSVETEVSAEKSTVQDSSYPDESSGGFVNVPRSFGQGLSSVHKVAPHHGLSSAEEVSSEKAVLGEVSESDVVEKVICSKDIHTVFSFDTQNSSEDIKQEIPEAPAADKVSRSKAVPLVGESNPNGVMELRFRASTSSKQQRELPPGIGSIHVNAVTVTCSCSSVGLPHVPTKACACYSSFWEGGYEKEKVVVQEGSTTNTSSTSSGGEVAAREVNQICSSSSASVWSSWTAVAGFLLPLLFALFFVFFPSVSGVSREDFFLSFRDVLLLVLGACIFSLVQRRPVPLLQMIRRNGVNSRPPSDT
ncbi:hypothetical protein R1flu_013989 [Riccia fluitans]|uniref:NAC domain-containing protein n=1 Tax=Riccia fluitans TaxID=41844 RepID=A0ABD1YF69_9MARC